MVESSAVELGAAVEIVSGLGSWIFDEGFSSVRLVAVQ